MAVVPGKRLAHYVLLEKLAEGGMGEVWKARDTRLDRTVALKLLPAELAGDAEWLARFERETKAIAALNHPSIVTIHSVEQADGLHFFTMELVPGRALSERIPPGGLPLAEFLALAVPLVDAVSATHEQGIVHRDLKPPNVVVGDDGRVKVLDFGLAQRAAREVTAGVAAPGDAPATGVTTRLWGTVPYMSPERLAGGLVDHRADLFALGVMLYEMVTGRRPFGGETMGEVAAAILEQTPPLATDLRPEVPPYLARVLRQCLEKDPARRPQSAREITTELEALRESLDAARRAHAPSVVVLPFADLSRERDQGYFCEGIAEEIIHALARLPDLRVASRTAGLRFRDSARDPREIGRELGVSALLQGGVRKSGDRLRITAELIDAGDGCCLWSEQYDRRIEDVFAVQGEIAGSIAAALAVPAAGGRALARPTTRSVEAYDLYLRGRQFFYQYSRKAMGFALELFDRAIAHDPGFAMAHAGAADCYSFRYIYVDRSDDNRRRADEASRRALALDPDLAQARVARGTALSLRGEHAAAEEEFQAAMRLDPQLFETFYFYARASFAQGKAEMAARLYARAMELRPDDYQAPLLVAQIYDDLGRPADADRVRRRGVKVAEEHLAHRPDDVRALYMAANAMVAMGEREWGLARAERALALDPDDSMLLYNVACIRSLAGEVEPALDCLERAVGAGLVQRGWIENDSNLDALRGHERYRRLLASLEARPAVR